MADDQSGNGHRPQDAATHDSPPPRETQTEVADELERQARETVDLVRQSVGDLGARVRGVMDRAGRVWEETHPEGDNPSRAESSVPPADEQRARALAKRWVTTDFLVEPELPGLMGVSAVDTAHLWRLEIRERGESRSIVQATEPYRGEAPAVPGPVLPVWDYVFPIPDIEAGERRERLAPQGSIGACLICGGTGHVACASCEAKGFVPCPVCRGNARTVCAHCRGRGVIADPVAERRANAHKGYFQVQAERIATDTAGRLADIAERLRQEHGVPLPPSAEWAPVAPASGRTVPCPDCVDGFVPCSCQTGKVPCATCQGSGYARCPECGATGKVIRHQELVRRFDTRLSEHTLATGHHESAPWTRIIEPRALRRTAGVPVWDGTVAALERDEAPADVPPDVWAAARAQLRAQPRLEPGPGAPSPHNGAEQGERRVIAREARISEVPMTRVSYTFGDHPFSFIAYGKPSAERFWAEDFPPRWQRVSRFLRALARDLASETRDPDTATRDGHGRISTIDEYRRRRSEARRIQRVRIIDDSQPETTPNADEPAAPPPPPPPDIL